MPDDASPESRQHFLDGMSRAACTVSVVTTDGQAGRAGVTVSSMSSVSADSRNPTLLVCIHKDSPAADAIRWNAVFCVNVLRDDQSFISDAFAGRFKDQVDDKFDCANWTTQVTGAPRVVDPLVSFDCRLVSENRVGTHYVLFGEVEDIFIADQGTPLIYANRAYGVAARIDSSRVLGQDDDSGSRRLAIGCHRTFGPYFLPRLIARLISVTGPLELNLVEGDQRRVHESLQSREVEIGLLYDSDLSDEFDRELLTAVWPYVLLPEGHPLAAKRELGPDDLATEPMVLMDAQPGREFFMSVFRNAGVEPRVAFRSTSFEMVRGMVGHGLGYSLLGTKPAFAMTYDGRALVTRPFRSPTEAGRVALVYRRSARLSGVSSRFAALCREFFHPESAPINNYSDSSIHATEVPK